MGFLSSFPGGGITVPAGRLLRCLAAFPLGGVGVVLAGLPGAPSASGAGPTTTFVYTGTEQSYTVPTGATAVTITATGATGGPSLNAKPGGNGATVTATLPVPAGTTTLYVEVGGAGAPGPCFFASQAGGGGFNGGGSSVCGGGGGGASDVRTTPMAAVADPALTTADDSRLVVAGGGGGGGYDCGTPGGTAGDETVAGAGAGGAGSDVCGGAAPGADGGLGGTNGGSGGAGTGDEACPGASGTLGQGGDTSFTCDSTNYGGAGGGGWYGGGAGGDGNYSGGGGGAGSSFWSPSATSTSLTEDGSGPAEVQITAVVTAPDLSLADPGPGTVTSGSSFSYTVVVANTGGSPAHDVVVADTVPATTKYDSVSTSQGTCSRLAPTTPPKTKGGTVTCTAGDLVAGGAVTITITVMATTPGTVTEHAVVTAAGVSADSDDVGSSMTLVQGS